jgi:hypothetical protein
MILLGCSSSPITQMAGTFTPPDRHPDSEVERGVYVGTAVVTGKLQLNSEKGLKTLTSGPVTVVLKAPDALFSPIKYFRGDRVLVIKKDSSEYVFKIPNELMFQDGKISVSRTSSQQNAHVTAEETVTFVNSEEQEHYHNCNYQGLCRTCGTDVKNPSVCSIEKSSKCSGTQNSLYKVDFYNRSLKLKIYNDEGSAEINTADKREMSQNFLKDVTTCN